MVTKQVLAQDGSVLQLASVLKKLNLATRSNSMDAAGKLHATADVVHRRITSVTARVQSGSAFPQVNQLASIAVLTWRMPGYSINSPGGLTALDA